MAWDVLKIDLLLPIWLKFAWKQFSARDKKKLNIDKNSDKRKENNHSMITSQKVAYKIK